MLYLQFAHSDAWLTMLGFIYKSDMILSQMTCKKSDGEDFSFIEESRTESECFKCSE